ncbi:metallophosphoesterase [Sphaerisporangium perillae]|uniref:metallophosphoesterase n=1 Tax=Sphaerisporangium perillae TaxID=2935860 RepID=UPI00200BC61A|nr:metallophosphoesterase [Sphaerisporangium perillae]
MAIPSGRPPWQPGHVITLVHVSDPHIDGSPRNTERVERVVRHISGLPGPIDAVLVTGDIADHATVEEYELARELLRFPYPTIICPGNHDSRPEFRKVMLAESESKSEGTGVNGSGSAVNQVLSLDGVTVALCDSSIPGRHDGRLDDETLRWLTEVLDSCGTPVIVGMHHQPVPVGVPYVDDIRLNEPERLEQVLRAHPRVVGLLVGHVHTPAATMFAGLPVYVAPGVASTTLLPQETTAWPPVDTGLPPGFALHVLSGDGRLTSHARVVHLP